MRQTPGENKSALFRIFYLDLSVVWGAELADTRWSGIPKLIRRRHFYGDIKCHLVTKMNKFETGVMIILLNEILEHSNITWDVSTIRSTFSDIEAHGIFYLFPHLPDYPNRNRDKYSIKKT